MNSSSRLVHTKSCGHCLRQLGIYSWQVRALYSLQIFLFSDTRGSYETVDLHSCMNKPRNTLTGVYEFTFDQSPV